MAQAPLRTTTPGRHSQYEAFFGRCVRRRESIGARHEPCAFLLDRRMQDPAIRGDRDVAYPAQPPIGPGGCIEGNIPSGGEGSAAPVTTLVAAVWTKTTHGHMLREFVA